jgi:hypothetical protein
VNHVKKYSVSAIKKRKLTIISQTGTDCNNDLFKIHKMAKDKFNTAFSTIAIIYPAITIKEPISVCGILGVNLRMHAIKKQQLKIKATFDKARSMFGLLL